MTREEAIKFLSQYIDNDCYTEKCQEANRMAISALRPVSREQLEKMRGEWIKPHWKNSTSCAVCSQCGFEAHHHEYHGVQDTYLFCPRCMAPMTDEAVDMVMKRWEALKDGKGD
jgi:hypothetical protein|nr:MAG TPA: DNA-directed RNA polymerase [Caudoviricetes sp.]